MAWPQASYIPSALCFTFVGAQLARCCSKRLSAYIDVFCPGYAYMTAAALVLYFN